MSQLKEIFGQDAVRLILNKHGNRATPDQIRTDLMDMIKDGTVAASMEHTLGRALNAMRRSYEIRITTDKRGHILSYELVQ